VVVEAEVLENVVTVVEEEKVRGTGHLKVVEKKDWGTTAVEDLDPMVWREVVEKDWGTEVVEDLDPIQIILESKEEKTEVDDVRIEKECIYH
jgi:hypothetical protein